MYSLENIINGIVYELQHAERKHPDWPRDIVHAAAIVNEESGELIRASLQVEYENGELQAAQKEAIQTAVTAIRFLKNLSTYTR